MRRIVTISAALAACALSAVTAAGPAVAASGRPATTAAGRLVACSENWGTNAKHHGSDATAPTPVTGARAGQHSCFDRLVLDLGTGPQPSWSAQYVRHIIAQGSGRVLSLRGAAKILVVVRGPAGHGYHQNAVDLVNVTGFATFRQVRGAGSFERVTALGIGARAKLPFRVFMLGSGTTGWRLVVDVAH